VFLVKLEITTCASGSGLNTLHLDISLVYPAPTSGSFLKPLGGGGEGKGVPISSLKPYKQPLSDPNTSSGDFH
jgi:hypothetical protein